MMYAAGLQNAETLFCGVRDSLLPLFWIEKLTSVAFSGKNKANTTFLC